MGKHKKKQNAAKADEWSFNPADYREGQRDPLEPSTVIDEIVSLTHEFVIFIDGKNRVVAHFPAEKLTADFNKLNARMEILQNLPTEPCKALDVRIFNRLLASAIQSAYYGDREAVERTAAMAEQFIGDRKAEVARRWNVQASTLSIAAIGLSAAVVGSSGYLPGTWSRLGGLALFGVLGAYFSMLLRLGKVPWDASAGPLLHAYETIARLVVGFISGLLIAIAADAELLLNFASQDGDMQYRLMSLACFVSGFSERLLPNFVAKFESQITSPDTQPSGDKPAGSSTS